MARAPREERITSTRPSARWQDAPHLVAMRGRAASEPAPAAPPRERLTVSLQTKILVSYLFVGLILVFALPTIQDRVESRVLGGAILLLLTAALGRVEVIRSSLGARATGPSCPRTPSAPRQRGWRGGSPSS